MTARDRTFVVGVLAAVGYLSTRFDQPTMGAEILHRLVAEDVDRWSLDRLRRIATSEGIHIPADVWQDLRRTLAARAGPQQRSLIGASVSKFPGGAA